MALRLRRGTDAQRGTITPAEGELIYTTDTKKIYAGDGSSVGGNIVSGINNVLEDVTPQLGGTLDTNSQNIQGVGNIDITGTITASGTITATNFVGDYKGSIVGDDSSILVDAVNSKITGVVDTSSVTATSIAGTLTGTVNGTLNGSVNGTLTGDVVGSVFADDSTVMVDAISKRFTGERFTGPLVGSVTGNAAGDHTGTFNGAITATGTLDGDVTGSVFADDSTLMIDGINTHITAINITSTGTLKSTAFIEGVNAKFVGSSTHASLELRNNNGASALADDATVGRLIFGEDDSGAYWTLEGTKNFLNVFPNPTGTPNYGQFIQFWKDGRLQIRGETGSSGFDGISRAPAAVLEVYGNAQVTQELLLGNMTTTERDALTAANGMIIYNTTLNKFQGYENGAWANLI